jgi:hypothetical protein
MIYVIISLLFNVFPIFFYLLTTDTIYNKIPLLRGLRWGITKKFYSLAGLAQICSLAESQQTILSVWRKESEATYNGLRITNEFFIRNPTTPVKFDIYVTEKVNIWYVRLTEPLSTQTVILYSSEIIRKYD